LTKAKEENQMPDLANPFAGNVARQITKEELVRALRLDIAAEQEAIHMYTAQAEASEDALARAVLLEIADEERQHTGELMELLRRLAAEEQKFLEDGRKEVEEVAERLASSAER
jgi:rubrerythrin